MFGAPKVLIINEKDNFFNIKKANNQWIISLFCIFISVFLSAKQKLLTIMRQTIQFLAIFLIALFCTIQTFGQKGTTRIEPPFWWAGMENSNLELLICDASKPISGWKVTIKNENVILKKAHKVDNPRYLFLELEIKAGAKAGEFPIELTDGKETIIHSYQLLKRKKSPKTRGLSSNDAIYLLYPDRFSNGNPKNDSVQGMREGADRTNKGGRHGGDIEGILTISTRST